VSVWLRPDEAAYMLGITIGNVRVLAHRRKWQRQRDPDGIRYLYDDVHQELERRDTLRRLSAELHRRGSV